MVFDPARCEHLPPSEGHDARPSEWWVRQLLRGMCLSFKKPAKCVKDLHSPEQQHANTHRRPRREHRRDLLPPLAGASDRVESPRRQTSSAAGQHKGGHDIHGRP